MQESLLQFFEAITKKYGDEVPLKEVHEVLNQAYKRFGGYEQVLIAGWELGIFPSRQKLVEYWSNGASKLESRKVWNDDERNLLREQLDSGVSLSALKIPGRTSLGIRYQVYVLGIKVRRWNDDEKEALEKQLAENKSLKAVAIPKRSYHGIRSQAIRSGFYQTKKRKPLKIWSDEHRGFLRDLVVEQGMSARQMESIGFFSNSSRNSIGQQMRRERLVAARLENCQPRD